MDAFEHKDLIEQIDSILRLISPIIATQEYRDNSPANKLLQASKQAQSSLKRVRRFYLEDKCSRIS